MKKTTKSTKFIKAVLGLGTLVAIALPASIAPAYSYDPGMPVPAGLRSEAEMQGGLNYKHPEDTAAVLKNGVLYTGDLGKWDDNGRLHIIGRKKEILVLQDGTKIFLPEYESRIAAVLPERDFAVVTRDGKPALLLVDPDLSLQSKDSRAKEAAQADVQNKLRNAMAGLPRGQQLGAILFTGKPLPRTATGKIKRWELKY